MKVSIITVTYNSAKTLSRAMRSVCRQTYSDIEYILIDGESADTTVTVIKEFAAQYPNVQYVSEPDKGIYDAINKGIARATGDVIGLLNSDDVLASADTIAHVVAKMEETKADILYGDLVYCRYDALDHNPPRRIRYWKSNEFHSADMRSGWMPPHPTVYCRREVFEKAGLYRTDFRISADYEFILRAFALPNLHTCYLPEVMVEMETGGISNRNISTMCLKTREDVRAMRMHGLHPLFAVCCKVMRKFKQFFRK